jgi:hypothetical protein
MNTSVASPAATPRRTWPRVYPIALLPLVLLIVIEIVYAAPQARYRDDGRVVPAADAVGEYIGRPIGITFGAVVVAAIVFLLSNRRSWAANVAFALVLIVGCGLSWATAYVTSLGRSVEITNRARTRLTWHVQRTGTLQRELNDAGSVSVANFDQPGELEARLVLLVRVRGALHEAVTAGDATYDAVPGELARAGIFRAMRERALADFQRDMEWPRKSAAFKATLAWYDAAIALFRHLAATKETWSVTPGVNNIEFHTPEAKARGDALRDALVRRSQQALAALAAAQGTPATTTAATATAPTRPAAQGR